jgi:hypothetical protein
MTEPKAPDLTGRPRLNWQQAVEAMRAGRYVRQASQMYLRCIEPTSEGDDEDGHPWSAAGIYESGQEGYYLAHAWSHDDKPVLVFMGASSKMPFVPEGDHFEATDWLVVEKNEC